MSVPTPSDARHVVHLLNRAGFGPQPGQVKAVLNQGLADYLNEQLNPLPDRAVDARLSSFKELGYPISRILAIYRGTGPKTDRSITEVIESFHTAKILRAVESRNQLQELLVDFWFNHFNVNLQNMFVRQSITSYERDAIRPHVFGKFRDLLAATAAHPAMLFYLDNHLSKKNAVVNGSLVRGLNENYGRELLELHTVGVSAGYSQADVVAAARCFTGWTIDDLKTTGAFVFRPENHDADAKRVFGLDIPAGGGIEDGHKLLGYLATHAKTAQFISRKLAQRFLSDDPPPSLVDRCAKTFVATDGEIRAVVQTLLESDEFWSQPAAPKLKTPFEFVASALRAVGAHIESASPGLTKSLANMGMQPYFCTPPTGYSDKGRDWLSPLYLHRINFALALAANRVQGVVCDTAGFIERSGGKPTETASVIAVMNREIFADGLSSKTLEAVSAPGIAKGAGMLTRVGGLILASPEMQAR